MLSAFSIGAFTELALLKIPWLFQNVCHESGPDDYVVYTRGVLLLPLVYLLNFCSRRYVFYIIKYWGKYLDILTTSSCLLFVGISLLEWRFVSFYLGVSYVYFCGLLNLTFTVAMVTKGFNFFLSNLCSLWVCLFVPVLRIPLFSSFLSCVPLLFVFRLVLVVEGQENFVMFWVSFKFVQNLGLRM